MEETLSPGEGTSHRVNGIAIQARHFDPDLTRVDVTPILSKSKKRSIDVVLDKELPIYNAGQRCGPPSRAYMEVTSSDIEANVQKKNLLWILVRLHATEYQTIPGWTGFNIKVRNEEQVSQDNIGYLQTMFEVLSQSLKIEDSLRLNAIVVVLIKQFTPRRWKSNGSTASILKISLSEWARFIPSALCLE